jgi:hypothetical protein
VIDSGPPAGSLVGAGTVHFGFHSDKTDAPIEFQCALDSDTFAACSGAGIDDLTSLPTGSHTLQVRAVFTASIDGSQHAGPAVSRTFTVDATPPDTTIAAGPSDGASTTDTSATFTFTATEPGSSFRCSLDAAAQASCTSPVTLNSLTPGTHTFSVAAVDALGNVDPTPATRSWTVSGGGGPSGPIGVVTARWKLRRHLTKVTSLTVANVPAGATVTLTCRGPKHSCAFRRKVVYVAKPTPRLKLTSAFKGRALAAGTKIEVTITRSGMNGLDLLATTRNGKRPTIARRTLSAS